MPTAPIRMIAIDLDGTLLGEDGKVSPRNLAALHAAEAAGIEIVVATGRRHSYAMHVMRPLGLAPASALVSSNGTVTRTLGSSCAGSATVATQSIARAHLPKATVLWLLGHIHEFRNSLALTFDRVGPDGEDTRGALVVEHLEELTSSIGKWMAINEPYIAVVNPIEQALTSGPGDLEPDAPIQMMLCGTIARMARAEARLRELGAPPAETGSRPFDASDAPQSPLHQTPNVPSELSHQTPGAPSMTVSPSWVGRKHSPSELPQPITLHRTEYPRRDLCILDILPAGCSKGAALLSLAATRQIDPAQILAIGDNWNDISMLEIAGAAVLMSNAPEDLKTVARQRGWTIGPSNTADGVAEAIESALAVPC